MYLVIISIVISIVFIVLFIWMLTSDHKTSAISLAAKWMPPAGLKQQDLAGPILAYMYQNVFCGIRKGKYVGNQNWGPLWNRRPGNNLQTCNNEVDFWESGLFMEAIANYISFTNTTPPSWMLDISPDGDLQLELMKRDNGVWNDDALWFTLAFIRMYEVLGITKYILWANDIFNWILIHSYNNVACPDGSIETTSWWFYDPTNDPIGIQGYRNNVTISQMLDAALRFYDLRPRFSNGDIEGFKSRDGYWQIAKTCISALENMRLPSGLMADGGVCVDDTRSPGYTYGQGTLMEGFARGARIAFERGEMDYGKNILSFVCDLIDLMTLPPERNTPAASAKAACFGDYTLREACPTPSTDAASCTAASCCPDAKPLPISPACFSQITPPRNEYLATVSSGDQKISILIERGGNDGSNTDWHAFKGLTIRFMSYAVFIIKNDILPHWKKHCPANAAAVVSQAETFFHNNLAWVVSQHNAKEAVPSQMYCFFWQFSGDQTRKLDSGLFDSISTFSVVELINAAYLLGLVV